MSKIERKLNSVGKECFIELYPILENYNNSKTLSLDLLTVSDVERLLGYKSTGFCVCKDNSKISKLTHAKWFFRNNAVCQALDIIRNSRILDSSVTNAADTYYKSRGCGSGACKVGNMDKNDSEIKSGYFQDEIQMNSTKSNNRQTTQPQFISDDLIYRQSDLYKKMRWRIITQSRLSGSSTLLPLRLIKKI